MRAYIKKTIAGWLAGLILCANITIPAEAVQEPTVSEKTETTGVTVTSADQLMSALSAGETLITISGGITIGETADESGKMIPVEIPGNVTLQGADAEAALYCRCPLQITGDQVTIRNLQLKFESSEALNSVAHREIFLAGHSLVLDNVDTYLEGSDGSLGSLAGNEEELLPTVYAGGFEETGISANAALTIRNANENTMFEAIYMGHGEGTDSKVGYTGKATLSIGPKTVVRDGIYANQNSSADIYVTGAEYTNLSTVAFYGNENTSLYIEKVSVNMATLDRVGNVILKDKGYLQLISGTLQNILLQGGACLDASEMSSVFVAGDFSGGTYDVQAQTDTRGILVLAEDGTLSVGGAVTGTTLFHTDNRYFPGEYTDEKTYITAADKNTSSAAFVLPDSKTEYYAMTCESGAWTVYSLYAYEPIVVDSIEILSAPQSVDVSKIVGSNFVPGAEAPYCSVVWKDENGTGYTATEVYNGQFYASDMVIGIRTDYWNSSAYDARTDWGVPVWFVSSEDNPGYYYFYTESGYTIPSGSYTYLFCSQYFDSLGDVADVKAQLDGKVKAQFTVTFYDSAQGENPTISGNDPGDKPGADPQPPAHTHDAGSLQIMPAVPGKDGVAETVCTACGEVLKSSAIAAPKTVVLSKNRYTYNGRLCKPAVIIKDRRGRIIDSECYTVAYLNNKKVGKATVVVTLKGQYGGTMKKTFTIRPKKTAINKITSKTKSFVVKWKKVPAQITGYQIQYSTSKKFTKKTTKSLLVKNKKTIKKTIKKPKIGKKYYVRIRTYKTVKVNGKATKIYSAWSKVKTAK